MVLRTTASKTHLEAVPHSIAEEAAGQKAREGSPEAILLTFINTSLTKAAGSNKNHDKIAVTVRKQLKS